MNMRKRVQGEYVDMTAEEEAAFLADQAALEDEVIKSRVAALWRERYARETDPSFGVSPIGAGVLLLGVQAGNAKALAIQEWGRQLHAEAVEREATLRAGGTPPVEWSTPREKPYSISEIAQELGV